MYHSTTFKFFVFIPGRHLDKEERIVSNQQMTFIVKEASLACIFKICADDNKTGRCGTVAPCNTPCKIIRTDSVIALTLMNVLS